MSDMKRESPIKNTDAVRIELMVAPIEAYHNSVLISASFNLRRSYQVKVELGYKKGSNRN